MWPLKVSRTRPDLGTTLGRTGYVAHRIGRMCWFQGLGGWLATEALRH